MLEVIFESKMYTCISAYDHCNFLVKIFIPNLRNIKTKKKRTVFLNNLTRYKNSSGTFSGYVQKLKSKLNSYMICLSVHKLFFSQTTDSIELKLLPGIEVNVPIALVRYIPLTELKSDTKEGLIVHVHKNLKKNHFQFCVELLHVNFDFSFFFTFFLRKGRY